MLLRTIFVQPRYPDKLDKLFKLIYNGWTLWDGDAERLFMRISARDFINARSNPVRFIHSLSQEKLEQLTQDKGFLYELDKVYEKFENYLAYSDERYKDLDNKKIAYFSMEYGLHHSLPNYAGGLGILSGDHVKGSSDLGLPVIAIGLFYRYGYFNQRININGYQEESYTENNVYYLPITELKTKDGESVYIYINMLDRLLKVKVWQVLVGKVTLLLLDTNLDENPPEMRSITDYLYVADRDKRIMQEIILGYGGIRALNKIGIEPEVYHLNEGHSAFLIIERLRKLILEQGFSYDKAFAYIKSTTIFTTHTPLEAGNENFPVSMIQRYLARDIEALGIRFNDFIKYGALKEPEKFWLPALAIRFSAYINGVSKIHSEVSKSMWQGLFKDRLKIEVPIIHITNGVHNSWISSKIQYLLKRYVSPDFIRYLANNNETMDPWRKIMNIPDEELWEAHNTRKLEMIRFVRRRLVNELIEKGYSTVRIKRISKMLNHNYLTIAFARRFVAYKRASLLLRDKNRLKEILSNQDRPIQILFAGKAHPADMTGKNIIKEIIDFAKEYDLRDRVLFLEDYDMELAHYIVQGVDLWLNNPIKPVEASGTSGMKAGMNGVINVSVRDGWWDECYNGRNGWAISAGESYEIPELRDLADANQLYNLLEDISSLYYDRDSDDIPHGWVKIMKASMYSVTKNFNINRMLDEYTFKFYIPAIKNSENLLANKGAALEEHIEKLNLLKRNWNQLYIKELYTDFDKKTVIFTEDKINIECYVHVGHVDTGLIDLELLYLIEKTDEYEVLKLDFAEKYADNVAKYTGVITVKHSGIQSFNARIVPRDEVIKQLYPDLIKWMG